MNLIVQKHVGHHLNIDLYNDRTIYYTHNGVMYIQYLTQITYVFMRNCRVDFPQNTARYNGDYQ